MAYIAGAQASAGIAVASTWGTAVAAGVRGKLPNVEITDDLGTSVLRQRAIGSGAFMAQAATRGAELPSVSLTGDAGVGNNFDRIVAQMFGTAAISAEITGAQGDYRHTVSFNTAPTKYITLARQDTSTTTLEYPTCQVTSCTIKTTSIPGYLEFSATAITNKLERSSAANTFAALTAATVVDTEGFSAAADDDWWFTTQSDGTFTSGDQFNITSWSLTLNRPLSCKPQIKGAAGLAAPSADDLFTGQLTVTIEGLADHTVTAWHEAETKLKSKFMVEGTQIGSGSLRSMFVYLPQMHLLEHVNSPMTSPGVNAVTCTFELSKADSNPTGFSSTYPLIEFVNTYATALLA
jgi:hypothetical protein